VCALFGTLIGDVDGIYDPTDYNDRLLLGLKKTSTFGTKFTSGALNPPFPAGPILCFE
jgi:hypothetical protein